MATTNFLTVIKDNIEYSCQMYLSESEATTTDGNTLQVAKEGVSYWLALSPVENEYTAPLRVVKDDKVYYILTIVPPVEPDEPEEPEDPEKPEIEYVTIKVVPSLHQTITFTYGSVVATIKPEDGEQSFTIPVGGEYSFTVQADEGYIAGASEGIPDSGVITKDLDGKKKTYSEAIALTKYYKVTIEKGENIKSVQIIRTDTNTEVASGDSIAEGTNLYITATANEGYNDPSITIY